MSFDRTEDYMCKITMDALDRHVILDANVRIVEQGSKLKAYCKQSDSYLQFPKAIREYGRTFVADVVKSRQKTGRVFYRAYPGSIRDEKNGTPIA
jgi:hypothetical protein